MIAPGPVGVILGAFLGPRATLSHLARLDCRACKGGWTGVEPRLLETIGKASGFRRLSRCPLFARIWAHEAV